MLESVIGGIGVAAILVLLLRKLKTRFKPSFKIKTDKLFISNEKFSLELNWYVQWRGQKILKQGRSEYEIHVLTGTIIKYKKHLA